MANILIVYHSRSGNTKKMAEAIAQGVKSVDGATCTVKSVGEVALGELLGFDGIILGSPTYYGILSAELKKLLDDSVAYHGQLAGKVGGAFATSALVAGGNETTVLSILQGLLVHGMVIAGTATADHYGPVAVSTVEEPAQETARNYGRMLAHLAVKLHG